MRLVLLLGACCAAVVMCSAVPGGGGDTGGGKKSHVVDHKLSDIEHEDAQGQHNSEYDHQAFLGKEEAQKFDELSPEESRRRLGLIYSKMDKNSDNAIDMDELESWMKYVQNKYSMNDAQSQYKQMGLQNTDSIDFSKYIQNNYGSDANELEDESTKEDIAKDKRRWQHADVDGDGLLTQEEFRGFLHPEDSPSMYDIVIQETLDDIDTDKDGKIDLREYLADLSEDGEENLSPNRDSEDEKEFAEEYDLDGDGFLTGNEIKKWIIPDDHHHIQEESEHLFSKADADKDALLSRDEVLNNYKLFVGSQATDYGEAIERHDEF